MMIFLCFMLEYFAEDFSRCRRRNSTCDSHSRAAQIQKRKWISARMQQIMSAGIFIKTPVLSNAVNPPTKTDQRGRPACQMHIGSANGSTKWVEFLVLQLVVLSTEPSDRCTASCASRQSTAVSAFLHTSWLQAACQYQQYIPSTSSRKTPA